MQHVKSYLLQLLFSLLPDTRLYGFKAYLLRARGFQIGDNVRVVSSAKLKLRYLSVGDNTFISHDTLIQGGDVVVQIGRNVDIAPRCVIVTGTHELGDSARRAGKGRSESVTIGDGTWIGTSSTILGGVHIGRGCLIAAGSLVRDDVDDNCLVAGVPARFKRKLD
jgi:acetyltransferase-like isoleucine patch superfamily enzyme